MDEFCKFWDVIYCFESEYEIYILYFFFASLARIWITRNQYIWGGNTWEIDMITAPRWMLCGVGFSAIVSWFFLFLAHSLVNDRESGDHWLDSISAHYQSPDMNIFTRFSFPIFCPKISFLAQWGALYLRYPIQPIPSQST